MLSGAKWSFGVCLALAALALTVALANPDDAPAYLEPLGWLFFIGALIALSITILSIFSWIALWGWRYFHTVRIGEGTWYSRYWPLEGIAMVSGVPVETAHWAGPVTVLCHMEFQGCDETYDTERRVPASADQILDFPQVPVDLSTDPNEGETVTISIKAQPKWWRGRGAERVASSEIGITDHRDSGGTRTGEANADAPEPSPGGS